MPPALRHWWPLAAVGGLLALAGIASALSSTAVSDVPVPVPTDAFPTFPGGAPPTDAVQPTLSGVPSSGALPTWLGTLAIVLCGLVTLAIVVPLLWILLRNVISVRRGTLVVDAGPTAPPQARADEVLAALDAGLADLSDADRDPRRAVIACWVRLEEVAATAGTPRQPGDTSTDLVLRLLRRHSVDRTVLDRFAGIYREARYATHPVTESTRGQAQSALRHLRGELLVGVAS